jgi:antitoxin component of MazEF toxin-antitoxin module
MPPKKPVLKSQLAKDLNGALKEVLAHRRGEITLDTLLNEITPENRHPAVDTGAPVGREA